MEYVRSHSMRISRLGVGTYSLCGVYGKKDRSSYQKMIERAYERGVTLFDTSDSYGTEEFLGEVVGPFRREICLSTKLGVKRDLTSHLSYDSIIKSCEESLKRLRTEYIDIYSVHFDDPKTPVEETIEAFEDLRKAGKILHFSLGHLPRERVKGYFEKRPPDFLFMELSAVATQAREELLPLCRTYGVSGIAFSVTGRSILTGKYRREDCFHLGDIRRIDPLFHFHRRRWALEVMERLKEIGDFYGKTPVQTTIAWVLSQKGILSALMGPSSIEHLEENLGGVGWELSEADRRAFEDFLKRGERELREKDLEFIEEMFTKDLKKDEDPLLLLLYLLEVSSLLALVKEEDLLLQAQEIFRLAREGDLEREYVRLMSGLQEIISLGRKD